MTTSDASASKPAPASAVRLRVVVYLAAAGTAAGIAVVVALCVVWLLAATWAGGQPLAGIGGAVERLQSSFYANMAIITGFYVPILWLMWRAAKRLGASPMARFFPRVPTKTILFALFAGAAISALWMLLENVLTAQYGVDFKPSPYELAMFPATPVEFVVCIAVISLFGPFAEEFYFRGFLLGWLRRVASTPVAIVLSAVAFALVHGFMLIHPGTPGWVNSGEVFAAGLVMGVLAVRSGSLWPSYAFHVGYNTAVAVQAGLWPG